MNRQQETKDSSKKAYTSPHLIEYGSVRQLTQAGSGQSAEGGDPFNMLKKPGSDRRLKENIIKIGQHPLGINLYLFDYTIDHRNEHGYGRQFGVMADEVEVVMPSAVSQHEDGFKRVDYVMLGIKQTIH